MDRISYGTFIFYERFDQIRRVEIMEHSPYLGIKALSFS